MARKHADIRTAIWQDADWRTLTPNAQWMYFLLISQPDVNQLGVIALRPARWATHAAAKRATIDRALHELESRRFVVTDERAGELLIRTFIRNDEVWKKPNLMLSAEAQLPEVTSTQLLTVLRGELIRVRPSAAALPAPKAGPRSVDVLDRITARIPEPIPEGFPEPSSEPSGEGSPEPLGEPPSHVRRRGPTAPLPPSPLLPAVPPSAARDPASEVAPPDTTQAIVGEWIERCPKRPPERVIGQTAKEIRAMLAEGVDPDDVRRGMAAWHTKGLHPSSLPSAVHEVMNAQPRAPTNGARPSTTDQRVGDALAVAARLRVQEQHP